MKKTFLLLITSLVVNTCLATIADTTIVELTVTNFDRWNYNRPHIPLTADNISRGKITLLTTDDGTLATLQSPSFDCTQLDSLKINISINISHSNYKPQDTQVRVQLLNDSNQTITRQDILPIPDTPQQILTTTLPAPGKGTHHLTFCAPFADGNNAISIRRILVYPGITDANPDPTTLGDINNDGKVDISDINLLVNALLSPNQPGNTDLNNDNKTDISDLNTLINTILSK